VATAILRAMRADPAERFADVPQFLAALAGKEIAPAIVTEGTASGSNASLPVTVSPARKERRSQRFSCRRSVNSRVLNRSKDSDWQGQIVDISQSGICLLLNRSFHKGTLLTVALESEKTKLRSVVVRVVWARPEARLWKIGCEFDQPLAEFQI